LTNGKKAAGL